MRKFKEVDGDLIVLAKQGLFDVIAHGCNCQCIMGAGLAPQMAKAFNCDHYTLEGQDFKGDINKLGQIEYELWKPEVSIGKVVYIVNAYTQFGITGRMKNERDLDYDALKLCFKKMNYVFRGKHIGLPEIGCHLAGGAWSIVKQLIRTILIDVDVTVVH